MNSFFVGADEIVEEVWSSEPSTRHVECSEHPNLFGRRVDWCAELSSYVVWIDADKILFMQGNIWNLSHAAGVMQAMQNDCCFDLPAARIHRIMADNVKRTQAAYKRGDLQEQYGMVRPFTKRDIGSYTAQLIDGNHRAAAAMAIGDQGIPVYVGENYRGEVRKKDWVKIKL